MKLSEAQLRCKLKDEITDHTTLGLGQSSTEYCPSLGGDGDRYKLILPSILTTVIPGSGQFQLKPGGILGDSLVFGGGSSATGGYGVFLGIDLGGGKTIGLGGGILISYESNIGQPYADHLNRYADYHGVVLFGAW